jgi:hypothetical protein
MAAAALAGGVVVTSMGLQYGLTNVTGVGAGFFPAVAGALIAVSGVLWMIQLGLARRVGTSVDANMNISVAQPDNEVAVGEEEADEAEFPDRAGWVRVGIIAVAILAAALALPVIGYTLTMTLMLTAVLFLVSRRPLWLAAVIGVGAAVLSRLVFEGWLGTELPSSAIEFIARLGL